MSKGATLAALGVVAVMLWKYKTVLSMMTKTSEALKNRNVVAFLAMLRQFESGGNYSILYGCPRSDALYNPNNPRTFAGFATHPNIRIPFTNPKTGRGDYSTAAGAYQINYPTELSLRALGFAADFSPAAQDARAVQLLKMSGALVDIIAGDFEGAIDSASGRWASLPRSTSGQNKQTMTAAAAVFTNNGGVIA